LTRADTFVKPAPLKPITGTYIYTDQNYKAISDAAIDAKKSKLDYRRALEPKVQLPFETKPGETPRKIEIERKKRLFSTQNIQILIEKEIKSIFGNREISSYAQLLSYETFDDTEFEQRTREEWLNLQNSADSKEILAEESVGDWVDKTAAKHIIFPKIPIPAVALCRRAWLPCLVTAYDSVKDLWKVEWRRSSGWQLEHSSDQKDASDFEDQEDLDSQDNDKSSATIWMHRLNILFLAEDPFKFAKRYATAIANREDAANYLVISTSNS
jgi:dynein heavy chain